MSKIHVLPDENLGSMLREYVEVNRKANVGDKIVVVFPDEGSIYEKGDVFTIEKSYENHPEYQCGVEVELEDDYYFIYHSEYQTLEPTDIVHIGGKRYRLVNRKAKVGEKVIVVKACFNGKSYKNGDIFTVCKVRPNGIFANVDYEEYSVLFHSEYCVLEPVKMIKEGNNKSIIDLLTNIEQRLKSIEQKLERLERDTEQNMKQQTERMN